MRLELAACVAFTLALGGCSSPSTQLVVVVDSDFTIPDELSEARARVEMVDGTELSRHTFALIAGGAPADGIRVTLPFSFGLVPSDGDPSRRVRIVIQGIDPGEDVIVERRAVTGFLAERTLRVPMFLPRSCARVTCPEGQTCTEDGCRDERVDPETLDPIRPGEEIDGGAIGQGCTIAGTVVAAGELNPDNSCQECDPRVSSDDWSNDDENACDDSDPCTADLCSSGVCVPSPLDADGDGHSPASCGGADCDDDPMACGGSCSPDITIESCDGFDNDCDGAAGPDEVDRDGDGVRLCAGDCDDDPSACGAACAPSLSEGPVTMPDCTDGFDNDCDGAADGADSSCGVGCSVGTFSVDGSQAQDSTLREDIPTGNVASDPLLVVGARAGEAKRAVLYFDLAGIGAVTVAAATLTMRVPSGGGAARVSVHRVDAAWTESEVSWANRTAGVPWISPGGDHQPTALDTQGVAGGGTTSWDVTRAVLEWVSGAAPNHGLLLKGSESSPGQRDLYSSESPGPRIRHPVLRVDYCPRAP